jgi:very-short-patch-repair endonuclease
MDGWKRVARAAEHTRGVVTYDGLCAVGLSDGQIRRCVSDGRLLDTGYGVFRVGGVPPSFEGDVLAAVLEFASETWASHHTANRLLDLRVWSSDPRIELVRPTVLSATRSGARVHRSTLLPAHHLTVVRGIPCTTASRTLFDLARTTPERRLKRGIDRGLNLGVCTMGSLYQVHYELGGRGRPGTRRMRIVLGELGDGYVPPESELEVVGMALLDGLGFEWQVEISDEQGYIRRVDGLNRHAGLVVELDGRQHLRDPQLSLDRIGDRRLRRLGLEVLRLGWSDVTVHGEGTRDRVLAIIAAAAA